MLGIKKEGRPMLRNGLAMAKTIEAEDQPQPPKPERPQVSPEVNEVLHMLEALQSRCAKKFSR